MENASKSAAQVLQDLLGPVVMDDPDYCGAAKCLADAVGLNDTTSEAPSKSLNSDRGFLSERSDKCPLCLKSFKVRFL